MPNSHVDAIVARTEDFIATSVLPRDDEYDGDIAAAGGDEARIELQAGARGAGVFALRASSPSLGVPWDWTFFQAEDGIRDLSG